MALTPTNNVARQNTANSGGNTAMNMRQQNDMARALILAQSVNMWQVIASGTIANPAQSANVINITPRLVGFAKRFLVEITAVVRNNDVANDLTLTQFGPANLLSQVVFTDLSNNVRVQTAGWHLHMVATAKRGAAFGASYTNDSPINFGSTWDVIKAPQTIPAGGTNTGTVKMMYEIPLTYSDTDFRGGIWLGVTNATANLQLTINPNPASATGTTNTQTAVYSGTNSGEITSVTYKVYQNYLDQLPASPQGIVLPINDISTVYLLNNTTQTGIVAAQDFPVPYANFRDFLSTFAFLDQGGTVNAGSDVNYWAIQAANYINMINIDPAVSALMSRGYIGSDWPKGLYYFSHRHKPISTAQYGNQELILNASSAAADARLLMGYESFALVNLVAQAGALSIG